MPWSAKRPATTPGAGLPARVERWSPVGGVVVPLAITLVMVPFRDTLPNTDAALVLVLAILAVAAYGHRAAGYLAALVAGLAFDFFLTKPYERLSITGRTDLETTLLLLAVGAVMTELAARARRLAAQVARQSGYTAGIEDAAALLSDTASPAAVVEKACTQLAHLLDLRECRFDFGVGVVGGGHPRMRRDGAVEVSGEVRDIETEGLPTGVDVELLVMHDGRYRGRFLLEAGPRSRPSLAQRLVATAIADRVGDVLSAGRGRVE